MVMEEAVDIPDQVDQTPQTPPDKVKVLYDAVSHDYNLGTEQEFREKLKNPEKAKALYDAVGKKYNLGTYDDFSQKIMPKQQGQPVDIQQPGKQMSLDDVTGLHTLKDSDFQRISDEANANHQKALEGAQKITSNLLGNDDILKHIAHSMLTDRIKQNLKEDTYNSQGTDNTGNKAMQQQMQAQIDKGGFIPAQPAEVDQFTQQIKQDPALQKEALLHAKKLAYQSGDKEAARHIDKSLYLIDTNELANDPSKQEKAVGISEGIASGKYKYNPQTGDVVEPQDIGQSLSTASKNRDEDYELNDLASETDPQKAIEKLNSAIKDQASPFEPRKVPDGMLASAANMAGDQGVPLLKMGAAQLITKPIDAIAPGTGVAAANAVSAGIMAQDMAVRAFGGELKRSYAYYKNQGASDTDAYNSAKKDANIAMYNSMPAGFVFGAMGSGAAGKEAQMINDVAKSGKEGWINTVLNKSWGAGSAAAKKIYGEIPNALKTGSVAGAQTLSTNLMVNQKGREAFDDVADAIKNLAMFHLVAHSASAIASGGAELTQKAYRQTLQVLSRFPMEYVQKIMNEQIQNGVIKPIDAAATLKDLEEHNLLNEQIPKSIKNPDVRLDLMNWVEKRNALDEEAKSVSSAFKEPLKLKIEKIDEKINEISDSPEAKEEPKSDHTESYAGIRNVKPKTESDAIQEPSTGAVLQREQGEAGSPGSERGRMEQGQQGDEATQEGKPISGNEEPKQSQGIDSKEKLESKIRELSKPEVKIDALDENTFPKVKADKMYKGRKVGEMEVTDPEIKDKHDDIIKRADVLKKLIDCLTNA